MNIGPIAYPARDSYEGSVKGLITIWKLAKEKHFPKNGEHKFIESGMITRD